MKKPKASIVLPTYNRAHCIKRAINSVLQQSYIDFELIVVDDGSTDNTEDIVTQIQDKRIRYIKCEINRGANIVRNIGIKAAEGEIVMFQDSDDEWLQGKLEKQMLAFQGLPDDVGVVYAGVWIIDSECNSKFHVPSPTVRKKEGDIYRCLLDGNFVACPGAAVRAECFKTAGYYDESLPRLQEWELWIRLSKCYKFKYINEPLVHAYSQRDGIGGNGKAHIRALNLILKKHASDFKDAGRNCVAKHYCGLGKSLHKIGERIQGRKYLWKAVRVCPWNPKYLGSVLLYLLPKQACEKLLELRNLLSRNR